MILKTLPKNKNKTLWLCQPLILPDISFICNSERKEMITQKDWKCVICDQEQSVSLWVSLNKCWQYKNEMSPLVINIRWNQKTSEWYILQKDRREKLLGIVLRGHWIVWKEGGEIYSLETFSEMDIISIVAS